MSGLPAEYFRFGIYAVIGLIVSFVAEGMGLAIGATFSITVSVLSRSSLIFSLSLSVFVCDTHKI